MTSPFDAYGVTLDALRHVIDEMLDDYRNNGCLYHKDSVEGQRRRHRLAVKIRGLRRAIATTRLNQYRAREAERAA
jgi:hypothetical protein